MTLMTKEDLVLATKQRKLYVVKNFYKDFPSWEEINNFYDSAKETGTIDYNSFGTMVIENDTRVLEYYKKAVSDISLCHKGHVLFSMMIIHFINRNNNVMTNNNLSSLFSKFNTDNPKKIPQELKIHDNGVDGWGNEFWDPAVHSDQQDRLFIQGSGQSLWKVFHENKELNYEVLLSEGDAAYIPKGVIHSVESMCPRHSVSIAFSDDTEINSSDMV
jgi:mannose-6-phosphate isomerase-like protein (cupin superfamily)